MTEQYLFMCLTVATIYIILVGLIIYRYVVGHFDLYPKRKQIKPSPDPKKTKPLELEIVEPAKPIDYGEYKLEDGELEKARHEFTTIKFGGKK